MCSGRQFQVDGAETEKARVEKLLVYIIMIWPEDSC